MMSAMYNSDSKKLIDTDESESTLFYKKNWNR